MGILSEKITKADLKNAKHIVEGDFVKGVVDIERGLLAIDADLHADLEKLFLENGHNQYALWGINLYFDEEGEDFIEFDSMINLRPAQGNRSRSVEDPETREKIIQIVNSWIV